MRQILIVGITIALLVLCSACGWVEVQDTSSSSNESEPVTQAEPIEEENAPSELFVAVYEKYATRTNPFDFDSVVAFVSSSGYECEISEPTDEDVGTIKVMDGDDYIFFAFNLVDDVEMIMTVNYYKADIESEVSMNNYSTDGDPQYDSFTTHIVGESSNEVDGVNEQIEFLFS